MLYIDLPNRADIEALLSWRGAPAVSFYLATTPLTQDTESDRIALKNQLREAVAQLQAADTPKRAIWPIEQAVGALIEDDEFWVTQAHSLAIFVTPGQIRTFRLPNRLTNHVEIADRFHIKPLLRALTFPHNAWVLALSKGAVRLIEVTADLPPRVVKVPDLPRDMASALGRHSHGERTGPGRTGEETSEHALLSRYARAVDQALRPVLAGHERPLVVAATEPLASVFRSISTYPTTAEEVIAHSADNTPEGELAASARGILDRIYANRIAALAALYAQREPQGRATTDVAQVARAATFGAVDTLVVDMDEVVPGTVDDETGAVTFGAPDVAETYGVVDEIARRVLLTGGKVVSARRDDVPGNGHLAAILRYPL